MIRKYMWIFGVMALLALAGCQSSQPAEDTKTGQSGEAVTTVKVTETEWDLTLSKSTVEAGKVRFKVTNKGSDFHKFEVEGQGVEKVLQGGLQPGESGSLTVNLKPGTYEVYCPIPGHASRGMKAELTVK